MADKPRMQHFLRHHLEDPEYREQLQWMDSEKQVFRVLWMHAGRATFDKELHWKLFHKYREYRGHKNNEDPKQCFGMALKKSPSVTMIVRDTDDDWRYYRFITKGNRMEKALSGQNRRQRAGNNRIYPAHHIIQATVAVPSPYPSHPNSQARTAVCTPYTPHTNSQTSTMVSTPYPSHPNSQARTAVCTPYTPHTNSQTSTMVSTPYPSYPNSQGSTSISYQNRHSITEDSTAISPSDPTHSNTQSSTMVSTSYPMTYDYTPISLPPTPTADLDAHYSFPFDPDDTKPLPEDLWDLDTEPLRKIHQCQSSSVNQEALDRTFHPWPSWETLASSSCTLSPPEVFPQQHSPHWGS